MTDDRQEQREEIFALEAIFGESCEILSEDLVQVHIPDKASPHRLILRVHLPDAYPSSAAPILELNGGCASGHERQAAAQHLERMFEPGAVVLYTWASWLLEQPHLWEAPPVEEVPAPAEPKPDWRKAAAHALQASQHAEAERQMQEIWDIIKSGEPFTERKSTFQAHVAPVRSLEEVEAVMSALLTNNKLQRATHNIMAYRIHLPDRVTHLQDYDDDGETAAGSRLLKLLTIVGAENVLVVVSRWFGGVLLGPARFTHINNAARAILDQYGYIKKVDGKVVGRAKRNL
ncbi:g10490 [Coccomyxa elongata]